MERKTSVEADGTVDEINESGTKRQRTCVLPSSAVSATILWSITARANMKRNQVQTTRCFILFFYSLFFLILKSFF